MIGPIVYSHGVYIHSGFSPPLYIYSEFGANFYTLVNLELQGQQRLFSSTVVEATSQIPLLLYAVCVCGGGLSNLIFQLKTNTVCI